MQLNFKKVRKHLSQIHIIALFAVIILLNVGTYRRFGIEWDFLAYHLPFSLMHYDLTTFRPYPGLMSAFKGFPPIVHLTRAH